MTPLAPSRVVVYPPGLATVQVPASSRRAARAGMSVFMACRGRPLLAHHVLFAAVSLVGPRAIPGRRQALDVSRVGADTWAALVSAWTAALGPLDEAVVIGRRQPERPGVLALLLRAGRPVAFVKSHAEEAPLTRERTVLTSIPSDFPFAVSVPRAWGSNGGLHWLASAPLPPRPHRPVRALELGPAVAAIARAAAVLDRPDGTPEHWTPLHGDFAPWNVRRSGGKSWLLDWEDAGWGPPNADAVYWKASVAALWRRPATSWASDDAEAVAWWTEIVEQRLSADTDAWLETRLLAALGQPGAR